MFLLGTSSLILLLDIVNAADLIIVTMRVVTVFSFDCADSTRSNAQGLSIMNGLRAGNDDPKPQLEASW